MLQYSLILRPTIGILQKQYSTAKVLTRQFRRALPVCHLGNTQLPSYAVAWPADFCKPKAATYTLQLHSNVRCTCDKCGCTNKQTNKQTETENESNLRTSPSCAAGAPAGKSRSILYSGKIWQVLHLAKG